jgi:uncharacterized protein (DUF2237 family)
MDPLTGFYRDGCCNTGADDVGLHLICCFVTAAFLEHQKSIGNDLMTPLPWFPGLKPGDRWCVCAGRFKQSMDAGVTCPVVLESTHEAALEVIPLEDLKRVAFRVN